MIKSSLIWWVLPLSVLSACGPDAAKDAPASPAPVAAATPLASPPAPAAAPTLYPPVEPPAPGAPGGLPDDRTPISEAPFGPESAQGAANVVQIYFALLGEKKYGEAWALWGDGGAASGMTARAFAEMFSRYETYAAQIGAPGRIEGAAGSLHVEVPVVIYGRLKTGQAVHMDGPFRLRRSNNVPGATESQKTWRIETSGLQPSPVT